MNISPIFHTIGISFTTPSTKTAAPTTLAPILPLDHSLSRTLLLNSVVIQSLPLEYARK